MTDNKIDITDALKKSHKQRRVKENYNAHYDLNTYDEIQYLLDKNYLFDGKFLYKIVKPYERICKKTTLSEVKNACIHVKPPNKADNTLVSKAINVWKTETDIIATPDYIREENDLINWVLEAKTEITNIAIENDPRRWVEIWFTSRNIQMKSCNEFYIDKDKLPFDILVATMNCDFISNKPEKTRINLQVLRNALDLKISSEQRKIREMIVEKLTYKPDLNANMHNFITALLGKYDFITDMILRHFIWQTKRKIFGKKVYDHLMPIVYGSQGIGKSEAIKKFISPLDGLWIEGKFTDLIDDRNSKFFESNYIMFFDEMKGATKADIEEIKERITADFIKFRLLYSHNMMRVQNNCTFIGTSNKPVSLLIRDETGMRRFYEIEIHGNCDWEAINKIDYLAIWRDVDESLDKPFIAACREQIKEQQENNRDRNSVEQWIEEKNLAIGNIKSEVNAVYQDYCHFCKLNGLYSDSKRVFGIKLKSKLKTSSFPQNGKRYYNFNIEITDKVLSYAGQQH